MAQVAADALGLTPDRVAVRLGDTRLPESHPAIGSATAANATAAVMLAAQAAREKAVELALVGRDAPFPRAAPDDVIVTDSRLSLARTNLNITDAELLARNGLSSLVGDGDYDPVEEVNGSKAIFSFSAVFAEVRVDPDFGLVRLNRVVGAYDAGRIINPKRRHAARRSVASSGVWDRPCLSNQRPIPRWAGSSTATIPVISCQQMQISRSSTSSSSVSSTRKRARSAQRVSAN